MKIKRLVIENFKSIERIELIEPNPFTVFVGPNGSGKSNIFEALEFFVTERFNANALRLYGGADYLQNRRLGSTFYLFHVFSDLFLQTTNSDYSREMKPLGSKFQFYLGTHYTKIEGRFVAYYSNNDFNDVSNVDEKTNEKNFKEFVERFSRIFIRNERLQKENYIDNVRLNLSCSNLEKVLKRILSNNLLREEIFEWLELFVPGFKAVEVDDRDELHWFEESNPDYFTKDLISDGTYNILALLTAVYQSDDKPQFLCIEEPENGLNPKVIKEFINLCRYACEEFGHHIWLNTHSQTLVSKLTSEEIILVDKKEGATQTKQIKGMDLHGLPMDEAWLSNALGGGLPW